MSFAAQIGSQGTYHGALGYYTASTTYWENTTRVELIANTTKSINIASVRVNYKVYVGGSKNNDAVDFRIKKIWLE